MNRIYNLMYYINIFTFYLLFIDYLFIFNYQTYSIPTFIFITFIYLLLIKFYNKNHTKEDFMIFILYIVFLLIVFIYGIVVQFKLNDAFIILYHNKLLLIPHFIFMVYNIHIEGVKHGTKKIN